MLAADLRDRRAAGDAACLAVLGFASPAGDAAAAPAEHLANWMQAALLEAPEPVNAKPLGPLEVEVLRRELGASAPERIAVLVGGANARKVLRGCTPTIELLESMARLRPPQRRLAVRLMLQPGG